MRFWRHVGLAAALAAELLACTESDGAKERAKPAAASATSARAAASGSAAPKPKLDPRTAELLAKALACHWDAAGPNPACEDARAWRDARDVFAEGRADATLVGLLEDADDRARQLAAQALAIYGASYRTDRPLAERVVRAAEAEKSARAGTAVGDALARVDVERTELFERVRAIAVKHAVLSLRIALVAELAHQNPSSSPAFTLTLDLLNDSEKSVRTAALAALWISSNRRPDEACAAWRARIDDGDGELAARACDYLTWSGSCQAHYDALLASEERRAKDARADDPLFAKGLGNICEDPKATGAQKDRATELLKRLADQKTTDRYVRGAALEHLLRCDPNGKAFVARFAKDDDDYVKKKSMDVLRPR